MEPRHQGCFIQDSFLGSDRSSISSWIWLRFLCLCSLLPSFLPSLKFLGFGHLSQIDSLFLVAPRSSWPITSLTVLGSESHWNDLDPYSAHRGQGLRSVARSCVYPLSSGVRDIPAEQCGLRVEGRQVLKGKSDCCWQAKISSVLLGFGQ